jgi:lysozyme
MAVVNGIDVSHHNDQVDWAAVAADGIEFAFAKATEGVTGTDARFTENWSGIKTAGLLRGAYHFFHPASSPEDQANHFLAVMGPLAAGDLPPVLDIEETSQQHDEWPSVPAADRAGLVVRWLDIVEAALGVTPIIYTRRGWINQYLTDAPELGRYPVWLAEYSSHPSPTVPSPWSTWTFWQQSESDSVAGVNGGVDLDCFNGSSDDLRALTKPDAAAAIVT